MREGVAVAVVVGVIDAPPSQAANAAIMVHNSNTVPPLGHCIDVASNQDLRARIGEAAIPLRGAGQVYQRGVEGPVAGTCVVGYRPASDSPAVDPRHFRDVASSFATGVTVVTTHDDEHGPCGRRGVLLVHRAASARKQESHADPAKGEER